MTLEEFFEKLETEDITNYIVKLKYKYDCEEKYTFSNELLMFEFEKYVWLNDWNEGQTDIEVLEYFAFEDATNVVRCKDCDYWMPNHWNKCKLVWEYREANDYCSRAERKIET